MSSDKCSHFYRKQNFSQVTLNSLFLYILTIDSVFIDHFCNSILNSMIGEIIGPQERSLQLHLNLNLNSFVCTLCIVCVFLNQTSVLLYNYIYRRDVYISAKMMAEQQLCSYQENTVNMLGMGGWWGGAGQVLGLLRELEVTLPYKSHSAG